MNFLSFLKKYYKLTLFWL